MNPADHPSRVCTSSPDGSPGSPATPRKSAVARPFVPGNSVARPSRLSSSLSRLAQGAAVPQAPSQVPLQVRAEPRRETRVEPSPTAAVIAPANVEPKATPETSTDLDNWLALWEDREELIAYRLALIDGQFEALIRKRELEGAATPPPTVPELVASLTQLFPEV